MRYRIPLVSQAQLLSVALGGAAYAMAIRWCVPAAAWTLDISDIAGRPIVRGIPLVPGVDLLAQYPDLGFKGQLVVDNNDGGSGAPNYSSLGTIGNLYFIA